MPDGEDKKSVDERLRDIEDRLEIYNLIASHPPSADTAADYYTSAVYTEDGVFDRGEGLSGAASRIFPDCRISSWPAMRHLLRHICRSSLPTF